MTTKAKSPSRIQKALRNAGGYLLLVIITGTTIILLLHSIVLKYIYMYAEIINMESIQQRLDNEDPFSYDYFKHINKISSRNYYLIEIFDEKGNTVCTNVSDFLYSSEVSGEIEKSYAVGEVVKTITWINPHASVDFYYYNSDKISYIRYRAPMRNGDTIRLWVPSFQIVRNASIAANFLSFFTLVADIVISIVIILYYIRFAHPIAQMSEVAEAMANLDFNKKCKTYQQPNVKALAQSINTLSSSLSKTLEELNTNNEKLKVEVEHSSLIDESRKNFIANVSHELKTPIAIIQGYAEGLQLGITNNPESSEEYCSIILEETEKMHQMVLGLLNLEKIESGSYVPVLEEINLSEFIEKQLAAFAMIFEKDGITVKNLIPPNLIAHSDTRTLLLVLQNFLSNATSNISKEKLLILSCDSIDDNYRIKIFNTGELISDSELYKIWYSFYKSNKKRKDEDLHFGLGLPTVRAVQEKLGKECGVYNKENGPCFWFDVGK